MIGIVLAGGCGLSVVIAAARSSIAGLPFNLGFAILGTLSVRQGV